MIGVCDLDFFEDKFAREYNGYIYEQVYAYHLILFAKIDKIDKIDDDIDDGDVLDPPIRTSDITTTEEQESQQGECDPDDCAMEYIGGSCPYGICRAIDNGTGREDN